MSQMNALLGAIGGMGGGGGGMPPQGPPPPPMGGMPPGQMMGDPAVQTCPVCGQPLPLPDNKVGPEGPGEGMEGGMGGGMGGMDPALLMALMSGGGGMGGAPGM